MIDLNLMSDQELEDYRIKVSKFVGLDPAQHLLKYIFMDNGYGVRNRVLYAPRGATEVLRAGNGISVTKLIQTQIDGNSVTFIAEGTNKEGRIEISAGAASTKDLVGERLSAAIMTASTRALRRMTLQFVGYGILDESEVLSVAQVTSFEAMSVAPAVQPTVAPSAAAGQELKKEEPQPIVEGVKVPLPAPFEPRSLPAPTQVIDAAPAQVADVPTGPDPAKTRKKRGPNKSKGLDLSSPDQKSANDYIASKSANADTQDPVLAMMQPEETLPIGNIPVAEPAKAEENSRTVTSAEPDIKADIKADIAEPTPAVTVVAAAVIPDKPADTTAANLWMPGKTPPTKQQNNAFRKELQRYADTVLPDAGMVGSEGFGGPGMKLKAYGKSVFPGLDLGCLSVEEQEYFLTGLQKTIDAFGPAGLVKKINDQIGAK